MSEPHDDETNEITRVAGRIYLLLKEEKLDGPNACTSLCLVLSKRLKADGISPAIAKQTLLRILDDVYASKPKELS